MKPQIFDSIVSSLVTTWWTPLFVVLFVAVLAYALWPNNRTDFDNAAKIPLRED